MQKLTKEEMKKVMGGVALPTVDTIDCNDGTTTPQPGGDCRTGSSGQCNNHGGEKDCIAYGHPIVN